MSQITVDASSTAVDTYLYALCGSGSTAQVLDSDAAVTTGAFTLTVTTAAHASAVRIVDLDDKSVAGSGNVTVAEPFTVEPVTAVCTAASPAGPATVSAGTGGDRTVSMSVAVGTTATVTVTVTCGNDGRTETTATARLTATAAQRVTGVTVTATSGESCTAATAAGFDNRYACTMTRGAALSLSVSADANTDGPQMSWTHDTAITVEITAVNGGACTESVQTPPTGIDTLWDCKMSSVGQFSVLGNAVSSERSIASTWTAAPGVALVSQTPLGLQQPDALRTAYRKANRAALSCTANGTATLVATFGTGAAAATRTARLAVECVAPVEISGLDDRTETGTGTVTVAEPFTVEPVTAVCTAASPTGTATARFSASYRDVCDDPIGVLAAGTTTRSGAITQNADCTSPQRATSGRPYCARRHTFTLDGPAAVIIDVGSAASNKSTLDTYLLLLNGHSPTGTAAALGRNDDIGPGHRTHQHNSRLTGIKLAPGSYTIEATTHNAASYDLVISAVTVNGISTDTHVVQNRATAFIFRYAPPNATITVPTSQQSPGVTATLDYISTSVAATSSLRSLIISSHSRGRPRSEAQNAWSRRASKSSNGTPCCSTQV